MVRNGPRPLCSADMHNAKQAYGNEAAQIGLPATDDRTSLFLLKPMFGTVGGCCPSTFKAKISIRLDSDA